MKNLAYKTLIILIPTAIILIILESSIRFFIQDLLIIIWKCGDIQKELKIPLNNKDLPFIHQPNKSINLYGANIKTDNNGFRLNSKNRNFKDKILLLGDSFTLGWGVNSDSIISNLIQEWYFENGIKVQTLNAGCGNYNTIMEVELFKNKYKELKPKVVILNYYINDMEKTPNKISNVKYFFLSNFYLYGYLFDKYVKIKAKYDIGFRNNYYKRIYEKHSHLNRKALSELSYICKENNIKLLITNIPDLISLKNYPYQFASDYIKNNAIELNVEFLDLYNSVKDINPELLWVSKEDPHANGYANYIFSVEIFKK